MSFDPQVEGMPAVSLLKNHMTPERAEELTKTLISGRWTHDYAITTDEALELGLPVRSDMPTEILDLLSLYPQPIRAIPSVECLPTPHPQPSAPGR
jgi:hypothetical protein